MWRFLNGATDCEIDFLVQSGQDWRKEGSQEDEQIKDLQEEMKIMRGNRKWGKGKKGKSCLCRM